MFVLPKPGMSRLIHERQIELSQIDDLDLKSTVLLCLLNKPVGNRQSHPTWARTGNYDLKFRFAVHWATSFVKLSLGWRTELGSVHSSAQAATDSRTGSRAFPFSDG